MLSAVPNESCVAAAFFDGRTTLPPFPGAGVARQRNVELRALVRKFDLPRLSDGLHYPDRHGRRDGPALGQRRETLRGRWDRFRARSPTLLAEVVDRAIGLDAAPLDPQQTAQAVAFEALDLAQDAIFAWTFRFAGHRRLADASNHS